MAVDDDAAESELIPGGDVLEYPEGVTGPDGTPPPDTDAGPIRTGSSWRRNPTRLALVVGIVMAVGLVSLAGLLAVRAHQTRQLDEQQAMFLQVARQGAINLTTIDYSQVDGDVKRILDTATGTFYDDFSNRAGPFIEVVKKARSKSVGTVLSAGVESETDHDAQVLVAVSVTTTIADGTEQKPRAWRMRISVEKTGGDSGDIKVSDVAFVP
ncbi:hypothetical protein [Mycolicibacterium palauense]|uniref:hypothetical protein n=1 Tax=Mycolicibacterium palauense TaxID=2034511 RepID=UPI000BFF0B47|nr:hypothetical protein [Mycolicibacterium palauense]